MALNKISDLHDQDADRTTGPEERKYLWSEEEYVTVYAQMRDLMIAAVTDFSAFDVPDGYSPVDSPEEFDKMMQSGIDAYKEQYPKLDEEHIRDLALTDVGMSIGEALLPVLLVHQLARELFYDAVREGIKDKERTDEQIEDTVHAILKRMGDLAKIMQDKKAGVDAGE